MDVDDVKELNGGQKAYHLKEKRKRGVRNVWDEFVSQSSLHGLHYIFERRPLPQRIIWLILQALMCSLFMWQTMALVLEYFEYKVSSRIELITERESNFPAVTLCNFNKYRRSVIEDTDFYDVLLVENPLDLSKKKPVNWTKYASLHDLNLREFLHKAGHQMQYNQSTNGGMLYRCTWKGEACNYTNFTTTLTDMGLCYTFNSGKNMTIRKAYGPGKYYGLHLRMSVEQDEYIGNLAFSAGLRIRIHDPDEPPLVSSLGFAVMPGSHVYASISREKTISLKSPYKTMCQDKTLSGIKSYTIAACHDHCKENHIAQQCDCQAFYMRDKRYKPCTLQQYFNCVVPLEEMFSSTSMQNCHCTEPCETTKYNVYLSYGAFPSIQSGKAYANNSTTLQHFRNNLVAINIFYEDLNYHVIKQVPAYSLQNLLGEIGGLMGLFLGASILTLLEFFDVLIMSILTRLGIHRQHNFKGNHDFCRASFHSTDSPPRLYTFTRFRRSYSVATQFHLAFTVAAKSLSFYFFQFLVWDIMHAAAARLTTAPMYT